MRAKLGRFLGLVQLAGCHRANDPIILLTSSHGIYRSQASYSAALWPVAYGTLSQSTVQRISAAARLFSSQADDESSSASTSPSQSAPSPSEEATPQAVPVEETVASPDALQADEGHSPSPDSNPPGMIAYGAGLDHIEHLPIMHGAGVMAPPKPELVEQYLSQDHFNAAEAYKWRKHELIRELQSFEHDTGSTPVRIGLLSQRIDYLTKHTQTHRKDHHGRRGLLILLSRRRKMLRLLRRRDFDGYVKILKRFNLKDNYYQSGWGERYRVGTNLKWTPDQSERSSLPPPEELRAQVAETQQKRKLKTLKAHRSMRFVMEDSARNVLWKAGADPHGDGSRVVTANSLKTHEYKKEQHRQRAARLTREWQERLKGSKVFYPPELSKPEFEQQRLQAAAQRGELEEEELRRLRDIRAAQKQARRARKEARRAEVEAAVLPLYRAGPAARRRTDTAT